MKMHLPRFARWPVLAVAVLACGCESEDADRLASIGRKVAARAEQASGEADGRLVHGWQAVRGEWDAHALDARVMLRLHWDKALADTAIHVKLTDEGIEMHGTVRDAAQKRRAVELAEATAGVEKVIDHLETAHPEQ